MDIFGQKNGFFSRQFFFFCPVRSNALSRQFFAYSGFLFFFKAIIWLRWVKGHERVACFMVKASFMAQGSPANGGVYFFIQEKQTFLRNEGKRKDGEGWLIFDQVIRHVWGGFYHAGVDRGVISRSQRANTVVRACPAFLMGVRRRLVERWLSR